MRKLVTGNPLNGLAIGAVLLSAVWCSADPVAAQDQQSAAAKQGAKAATGNDKAAGGSKLVALLNAENWETAKGLIPDEFLNRYKNGEWNHEIWEPPQDTVFADRDFVEAGKHNAGRYKIGPEGQVVAVATGKQPPFIYGPPFPNIDPNDPQAGAKCVWNFFYQAYTLGNSRNVANLDFVGTSGLERRLVTDVNQQFFDGQPEKNRPKSNPQNLLFQGVSKVSKPADLEGTVALSHRFRDPKQRDQQWIYVPALRRVRAVSPANRSDGFLGSDMSQDDGSYFDGKPEDFEWRLIGDGEQLVLYDRTAVLEHKHNLRPLATGGVEGRDDARLRFAYQLADWSGDGLAWQPRQSNVVLIKRPVWIVEGRPKDSYYLYGKLLLRFDKLSWRGTYNSKYDWTGEILNSYMPNYGPYFPVGGGWRAYSWALFTMSQNWRANRATVVYPSPERASSQYQVPYSDTFFTVDNLMRMGK